MKTGTLVRWNHPIPDLSDPRGYRREWKTGVIVDLRDWGNNLLLKILHNGRIITRVSDKVRTIK
jgi:hypothetical protein